VEADRKVQKNAKKQLLTQNMKGKKLNEQKMNIRLQKTGKNVLFSEESHSLFKGITADLSGSGRVSS